MSVRASLARLERSAARAFGGDGSPCKCQGPLLVIYDKAKGITPGPQENRCTACGRERTRINVHIVEMPLPPRPAHAA